MAGAERKKYTIWLDYNLEGWQPNDFDTLAECFDLMRSYGHSGGYRITRDVDVEIREREPDGTEFSYCGKGPCCKPDGHDGRCAPA